MAVAGAIAAVVAAGSDAPAVAPAAAHSSLPTTAAAPPRPPVLPALAADAPIPDPSALAARLAPQAQRPSLGVGFGGEVVDVLTGTKLWALHAGVAVPPASTLKLLTASAALRALGPEFRFVTTTERSGRTVYLVGGGDPTLRTSPPGARAYPRAPALAQLARRTAAGLSGHAAVRLRVDARAWTGPGRARGWPKHYLTEGDVVRPSALQVDTRGAGDAAAMSPTQIGDRFATMLRQLGVRVRGRVVDGAPGTAASRIAEDRSAPLEELVQRMLTVSDNDIAEALARAVAIHDGRPASFTGGAAAVLARMSTLAVPRRGLALFDGSGLSRRDRVTPRALVALLRVVAAPGQPLLRPLLAGLPVAGLTGTLADRYRTHSTAAAAGVVRAKTGTLTGVSSLAGLVVDRQGRLLAFAFVAPHAPQPATAETALDRLAASLR
ncbi:MAG TPA: D-alanyl-D-alanine carboxypeptidase/D-alanyl-D-alanine-endopeptidase [Mycobacteriales bacterium]|nr:D-alanyl-D-alanine carboxypeptidase/D-alanyl-D-alanine-endopeptidase [Mycobacteriales bacterium]